MDWQTIDTAPKDGTAFLGWLAERQGYVARQDVCISSWSEWGGGVWTVNGHTSTASQPTHWMPLPFPPKDQP